MTLTSIYDTATNTLREQPGMEKPEMPVGPVHLSTAYAYERALAEYNAHVAPLRTIPCSPEYKGVFKEGEKYVEGKDYEVQSICGFYKTDCGKRKHCEDCRLVAFPIQVKSEDDIYWYGIITLARETRREADATDALVKIFKENYALTKK